MTPKPESETDPWKAAEDAVYDPFCEAEEAWGIVDAARAAEAAQHQQRLCHQAAHIANLEHMVREHGQFGDLFQPGGLFHKDAQLEPGSVAVVAGGKWLVARLAAVEAERDALERLRVHCEHCGADYAATGVEAGCPCLVRAERDRLKAAFLELHATVKGECPSLLDPDRGGSDVLWALCAAALTPHQGQSTDGETK